MTIKFRVTDGSQEFLYARCFLASFTALELEWHSENDRHRESVKFGGAPNEQQLLEIVDTINDDTKIEWLNVVAVSDGQDSQGNDKIVYHVELNTTARNAWYTTELRAERDSLLKYCCWMYERHKMEIDGSALSSLTTLQFDGLVDYIQSLRDWPATEIDIYARTAPTKPGWL